MMTLQKSDTCGDQILNHYVQIGEVLGEMFSPILEIVVHDLRHPEESIIAIFNGHITGRKAGGSATDLGRRLMDGDFPDKVVGYPNESPTGAKLKSSSLAIRNDAGELIGVLGLNLDISYFDQFERFINQFVSTHRSTHVTEAEHFEMSSPSEDIRDAIHDFLLARSWSTRTLSTTDKRDIVEHLYRNGYFKNRGAVSIIARELGLSRPSIYNYKNDYIERTNGARAKA